MLKLFNGTGSQMDASKKCPCTPILSWVTSQQATAGRGRWSQMPRGPCTRDGSPRVSPRTFLHFFALCTPESLLQLPTSNMTILPAKQATCDLCGLHGSTMQRLPLENWSAVVLRKTWRCEGNAHVQIHISICVYLCLHLYYYIWNDIYCICSHSWQLF